MRIKILTWNIWQGKHLQQVIDFLKQTDADIIALQEVVEKEGTNTAEVIASTLSYHYIYYRAKDAAVYKPNQGNAILSKFPIAQSNRHVLSDPGLIIYTPETEPRIAVEAHILVNKRELSVLTTHLAYSRELKQSATRNRQAQTLYKFIHSKNTILMGDFNMTPGDSFLKKLERKLQNADPGTEKPTWTVYPFALNGFTVDSLQYRLDYLFVSRDIQVEATTISSSSASDHLPVSAIITI